jgi:hypothetical protein
MILPESDPIFLNELAKRNNCDPKELLVLGISAKIDIYSHIDELGFSFLKDHDGCFSEAIYEKFNCIYKLNKNDLYSLHTNPYLETEVSLQYDRGNYPNGDFIENDDIFDFTTEGSFDSFKAKVIININSLFTYSDVPTEQDVEEFIEAEQKRKTNRSEIAMVLADRYKLPSFEIAKKLNISPDAMPKTRSNTARKMISRARKNAKKE